MSADLTPFQVHVQGAIIAADASGFTHFAESLRQLLASDLKDHPPAMRPCYGRFKLNEADECALEVVEFPRRPDVHSLPLGLPRE